MNPFTSPYVKELIHYLNKLEAQNIYNKLNKVREDAIMVEVAVPGQRWEIEFMDDDTVEVEKFVGDGDNYDDKELETLFSEFGD